MAARALMLALLVVFAAYRADAQQAMDGRTGTAAVQPVGEDNPHQPTGASRHADAPGLPAEAQPSDNPINRWFIIAEGVRWSAAIADFETTRRYVPAERCVESAPLLGREPSTGRVYGVGVAAEAGATLASYLLQRHLRRHSSEDRTAALIMLEGSITAAHAWGAAHNGRCL